MAKLYKGTNLISAVTLNVHTTGTVQQYESFLNFPNIGEVSTLYVDLEEGTVYYWSDGYYHPVVNIEIIDGGSSIVS